jgi:hypothetical protein
MRACLFLVATLAAGPSLARADGPPLFDGCRWSFPKLCEEWRQRSCWCPDDYHGKCLPGVPSNPCGCVDDYCPKSLPCPPPIAKGCVDDYCPKKCPLFLGRLCEPWYGCVPTGCAGAAPCPCCPKKP